MKCCPLFCVFAGGVLMMGLIPPVFPVASAGVKAQGSPHTLEQPTYRSDRFLPAVYFYLSLYTPYRTMMGGLELGSSNDRPVSSDK